MRILLCVFNGELGWEIGHWQAYARKFSRSYDKTYVITFPGRHVFYNDFAEPVKTLVDLPKTHKIISWVKDKCYPNEEQEFINLGDAGKCPEHFKDIDILIHARNDRITFKNYPVEDWKIIVDELSKEYKIGCIGALGQAFDLPQTESILGFDLGMVSNIVANAKLVLGPSSGPMHLAQHCQTPVVVWADKKIYMGRTTVRQRIEEAWNPFGIDAVVLDEEGWQPKPETVIEAVKNYLKEK